MLLGVGRHVAGGADGLGCDDGRTAADSTSGAGGGRALASAGHDQLADELRQGGEDVEDQPPAGGGGVQVLVQGAEPDAAAAQVTHGGDKVVQAAGEPV